MPPLTRTFVKLAILWLVAGLGATVAAQLGVSGARPLAVAGFHAMTMGWLTQMVFGVAIWMFPKRKGDLPRGSAQLGWAVLVALNLGVALRLATEPFATVSRAAEVGLVVALSLQLAAAVGFALLLRGRIRG